MRILYTLSVAAVLGSLPAQDPPDTRFENIGRRIKEELVKRDVPSVALAVAQDGRILWESGFGWANREERVSATEHTIYRLASVSKPMTATGLMRLVEAGAIDLDQPVNGYLGASKVRALVGRAEDATLRMVANHTSGLTMHYNSYFEDDPGGPPSMDEAIRRWGQLMTVPGEEHVYSNLGYGILAYVIARTSGASFSDFMASEVFEPLGMDSTFIAGRPDLEGRIAVPYMPNGAPFPPSRSSSAGSGGVFSTAHDLVTFGMFHLENDLEDRDAFLSDETIDEMHRPTATAPLAFADVGYGVGWRSWTSDRGEFAVVEHTGQMEGATAILTLLPEEDLAIAVVANKACFLADLSRNLVVQELLGVRNLDAPRRISSGQGVQARVRSEMQGAWEGLVHAYDGDVSLSLEFVDRAVRVKLGDQDWADAESVGVRDGNLRFVFWGEEKPGSEWRRWPTIMTFTLHPGGESITGSVFADAAPDPVKGVPFGFTLWVTLDRSDAAVPKYRR